MTPKRTEFRFFDRLRVRWAEVDMQRIVFNGHYLMYFDTAVAAYWRAMAMPYHETMETLDGDLFVRKATVEYMGSARYDDVCDVGLRCGRIGSSSMQLIAAVFRGESVLVHGELIYVFAHPTEQTSRPVPDALREVLTGFERGDPMVDVALADWATLSGQARPLRHAVLVREQGIAAPLDEDAGDHEALHALACNRLGRAVGTGRLSTLPGSVGQIARMAVHPALRRSGVGETVLSALLGAAKSRGLREVILHAHAGVVDFYRRAGFTPEGEPFDEAGLRHHTMRIVL